MTTVILNIEVAHTANRRPARGRYQDATRSAGFKISRCEVIPGTAPNSWVFVAEAKGPTIGINGYARQLVGRLLSAGVRRVAMLQTHDPDNVPHWFYDDCAHQFDKTPTEPGEFHHLPDPAQASDTLAKIDKALAVVAALCDGSQRWTMSVPARVDSDPDLVIADALRSARDIITKAAP